MYFVGACLGGELDGISGILRVSQDKSHGFACKSAVMLSCKQVNQVASQHWAGVACFSAGFRRPIFSVLQDLFQFLVEFDERECVRATVPPEVRTEILLASLLIPFMHSNLRAPLRPMLSISDASEVGGSCGRS